MVISTWSPCSTNARMVLATAAAHREEGAAGAAFQLAHRFLQREVGQGAATPVEQLAVGPIAGGVFFGFHGIEKPAMTRAGSRCSLSPGYIFCSVRR